MNMTPDATTLLMPHYPHIDQLRTPLLRQLVELGTPLFVCERANLLARYRALQESLSQRWARHIIGYSFKTNYLVAQSGILQAAGAWAEVVSGREYELARRLGYDGAKIVFNGPLKSDADLRTAIGDGALINVNDHDELDHILALAAERREPLEIGMRVSGTLPRLGHSRFGFSLENGEATAALTKLAGTRHVRLVALHTHLYGDTDDAQIYAAAAQMLGEFAQRHIVDYRQTLKYVDLGGGYPAHGPKPKSRIEWDPQPIDAYVRAITDSLRPFFPDEDSQPALIVEPGRYLTGDGILLVTHVAHVKTRNEKQMVNCDGSISMIPLTHYCPQIIQAFTSQLQPRQHDTVNTIIYGSTCRENDVLYEGPFPAVERGDYLIHFAAGAYNSSLSPDFIFAAPTMAII